MFITKSVNTEVDVTLEVTPEEVIEQAEAGQLAAMGLVGTAQWQSLRRVAQTGDERAFVDAVARMAWTAGVYIPTERLLPAARHEAA